MSRRSVVRADSVAVARVALVVFAVNFLWESVQCVPFFRHGVGQDGPFILVMARAAAGDVLLTAWIVWLLGIATRDAGWWTEGDIGHGRWALVWLVGVATATAVEKIALATGRWSYTAFNPQLPGLDVSLLPLLQLPVCLWCALRVERRLWGPR